MSRPRVLLILGYFDWFAGYQEAALAPWLARHAEVEVVASDRVSPMFSDEHLSRLGIPRRYEIRSSAERGLRVTRFPCAEWRGMVWSGEARRYVAAQHYDAILQVMPGQGLPLAGTLIRSKAYRASLYGDNSAMWSHLSPLARVAKGAAFAATKGVAYTAVNARAQAVYGYTPETVGRLRLFSAGRAMRVLPLAFDPERFFFDPTLRRRARAEYGFGDDDIVVIAAGKYQDKKRLDLLLDATEAALATIPNLRLLIAGVDTTTSAAPLLQRVAKSPAVAERTTFRGFLDTQTLNEAFNAADIGAWPRMPAITIQQAMGTGLKVVIPRNPWVSHLITNGAGTYFVESNPEGTEQLTQALVSEASSGLADNARGARVRGNSWLGADRVAHTVLSDAGLVTS